MKRGIRRTYHYVLDQFTSLWEVFMQRQTRLYLIVFVVLGVLLFVTLHTIFSAMNMQTSYQQHQSHSRYIDPGAESASGCLMSMHSTDETITRTWRTSLVEPPILCENNDKLIHLRRHQNTKLKQVPHVNTSFVNTSNNFNEFLGIRRPSRFIIPLGCEVKANDNYTLTRHSPPPAGSCYEQPSSESFFMFKSKKIVKCLPSFIIAGTMKSGTGELMKWLQLHPFLRLNAPVNNKRESHFFSSIGVDSMFKEFSPTSTQHDQQKHSMDYRELAANYSRIFPSFFVSDAELLYTYEKSPDYIRSPAIMQAISQTVPGVKIIVVLRNPAIRAVSEFNHQCRHRRYVKLLRDVAVSRLDVSYPAGSVLLAPTDNSRLRIEEARNFTLVGKDGLVEGRDYVVLNHCTSDDMVNYFTARERLKESAEPSKASSHTINQHNLTTLKQSTTIGYPEEIFHSFYYTQLKGALKQ